MKTGYVICRQGTATPLQAELKDVAEIIRRLAGATNETTAYEIARRTQLWDWPDKSLELLAEKLEGLSEPERRPWRVLDTSKNVEGEIVAQFRYREHAVAFCGAMGWVFDE